MIRKIAAAAAACSFSFSSPGYCVDGVAVEVGRGDDRTSIHSGKYDLGMRIQHLSNGGFHSPNPGINFVLMRLQYAL